MQEQMNLNIMLGQNLVDARSKKPDARPDTDCRHISIIDGTISVYPNLLSSHTHISYIVPVGNIQDVHFYAPSNIDENSLHYLVLDNSNNTAAKTFFFSSDYEFLSSVGVSTHVVGAGKKLAWYGVAVHGKIKLRLSMDSTN